MVIKILKKFFLVLAVIFGLCLVLSSGWFAWQYYRDPISAFDKDIGGLECIEKEKYIMETHYERRIYTDFTLFKNSLDSIKITASFPTASKYEKFPVIIILGGLEIGRESLKYVKEHGNNIVIAYEYPYSPRYWYDGTPVTEIPVIRKAILKTPPQVLAVANWVKGQPWSDGDRINIVGYSFGAMFVPAVYHLATKKNLELGKAVIAYGGADIHHILLTNLKFLDKMPRLIFSGLASLAIHPIEPTEHLPYMNTESLIINGRYDHQIPKRSWTKLQELTPEPKEIINLNSGHMHPSKPQLTQQLIELTRQWLSEKNAINP